MLTQFILTAAISFKTMAVTGVEGQEFTFTCKYSLSWQGSKYLCHEANTENCKQLIWTDKQDQWRKYSIRDEGNTFYVTIFDLKKDDEGTYWCGIDRVGIDTYNKVVLTVSGEGHILHHLLIIFRVKCFIFLCCKSMFYAEQQILLFVNHGDHHYEEILGKKDSGGVVSSVYANVSSPTDQLHYASVNFQNDSTTVLTNRNAPPDTDKNGSSTCDYSSISGTPNLYSTVIKPEGP
uniref:Immunoglobulin domain-containing protein n=1 Tax=Lates calcarifer TaxID=8187 RepID=A0A4W6DHT3_LATCA